MCTKNQASQANNSWNLGVKSLHKADLLLIPKKISGVEAGNISQSIVGSPVSTAAAMPALDNHEMHLGSIEFAPKVWASDITMTVAVMPTGGCGLPTTLAGPIMDTLFPPDTRVVIIIDEGLCIDHYRAANPA